MGSSEDDVIEAEIQRLLHQKQQQLMSNQANRMGANPQSTSSNSQLPSPQPYMGDESVLLEYQKLMRQQHELNMMSKNMMTNQMNIGMENAGGTMMMQPMQMNMGNCNDMSNANMITNMGYNCNTDLRMNQNVAQDYMQRL